MKSFILPVLATLALRLGLDAGFAAVTTNFVPSNPPEMKRLAGRHSPAHRAAKRFRHGINLANYLEVPPGQQLGRDRRGR